jgi:hypothetical protein
MGAHEEADGVLVGSLGEEGEGVIYGIDAADVGAEEVGAECGEEWVLVMGGGSGIFRKEGNTDGDGSEGESEEDFAVFVEVEDEEAGIGDEGDGIDACIVEAYGKDVVTKVKERTSHEDLQPFLRCLLRRLLYAVYMRPSV